MPYSDTHWEWFGIPMILTAKEKNKIYSKGRVGLKKIYDDSRKHVRQAKNQSPESVIGRRHRDWTTRGVIFKSNEDREYWYDRYVKSEKCEVCNKEYKDSSDRCLDHDHSITDSPNVRQIICRGCNCNDSWKKHLILV